MENQAITFQLFETLSSIGVYPPTRQYDIVRELRFLFQKTERTYFNLCMSKDRVFVNQEIDNFQVAKLVRYALIKSISFKNPPALSLFSNEGYNKTLAFYGLIRFTSLLHGNFLLTNQASKDEFWNIVNGGQLDDPLFLSFHAVHYLLHIGCELCSYDIDRITSLVKNCYLYTEERIEDTRLFSIELISELKNLWKSGLFDDELLSYKTKMETLLQSGKEEFLNFHYHLYDYPYQTAPIFLLRLENL